MKQAGRLSALALTGLLAAAAWAGLNRDGMLLPAVLCAAGFLSAALVVWGVRRWRRPRIPASEKPTALIPPGERLARSAPAARYYLSCRGGFQDGREYPILDTVKIGRTPDNHIKYPDAWPQISRHHAVVRLYRERAGDRVELTDLSSAGTWLKRGSRGENNPTRLRKNTPVSLAPGDVFYLGTQENRFALIHTKHS